MNNNENSRAIAVLEHNIAQVVLGKTEVVRLALVTLLAGEHLLLEDVPGVGKTLLAKSLAKSIKADFNRVQFTPDLLPADILGGNIYQPQKQDFTFLRGPVFTNILLADEINRTTPRTQSALLEAMSERQVSIDGETYPLSGLFMVIATQNPFEFAGTFPLPESQMDRFLMRVSLGYPQRDEELKLLENHRVGEPVDQLQPVVTQEQVLQLQRATRAVKVEASLQDYLLSIVHQTRETAELKVGVSTRGALCLYRAAQALAQLAGRDYCIPDDIKSLAVPVLSHRVLPAEWSAGEMRTTQEHLLKRLVEQVAVPR